MAPLLAVLGMSADYALSLLLCLLLTAYLVYALLRPERF